VSGGARAERASSPLQSSFALDVWYAVRIEYAPAPPRLRVEVEERAEGPLAAAGAEGRARTVFSARLPLSRPLADGRYVLGAVAPEDEPDGAPATLVLRDLRFRTTRAAIARGAPLPGDGTAGDFFRATAAAATGRPAEAMLAFRRAAAGDPLLDAASFGEGLAAREAGDLAAAVRAFAGCMRTVSRAREELRRVLAEIETHGSREDLLAALEAYLAVEPDDSWARAAAENARRRLAEALDQEALALPDPGPARRVQRGRLYLRAALPAKALAEADAAVAASLGAAGPHPGDASAFLLRADALAALGRAPLAAVDYARAHRRDPGAPEPLLGLARLYLALPVPAGGEGSPAAAAEAALSQAEPLARDPAELYVLRARARLAQGKIALARDDAARAARLAPRSAAAHAAVAAVALREGRRDAARAALALAARFGPVDPALLAAARVPD
jgi:tetratricopeptide (TPR) repeat protein